MAFAAGSAGAPASAAPSSALSSLEMVISLYLSFNPVTSAAMSTTPFVDDVPAGGVDVGAAAAAAAGAGAGVDAGTAAAAAAAAAAGAGVDGAAAGSFSFAPPSAAAGTLREVPEAERKKKVSEEGKMCKSAKQRSGDST